MNYKTPINPNYAAVVTTTKTLVPLEKCDNVQGMQVFGYQAIVSKNAEVGETVIVFTAETQLSHEYCAANNLYRDSTMNADPTAKGYIEANRRVRSMKFRGHRSDALVMPVSSMAFTGIDVTKIKDGDTFDEINGIEICKKYEIKRGNAGIANSTKAGNKIARAFKRVDTKFLPEHYTTDQWFRNSHTVDDDETLIITQKLHGTSIRIAHVPVMRQLTWKDKIAKFFGIPVVEKEYDHVYGSRRVIKDINNPTYTNFYNLDVWSSAGKKIDHLIPENYILYGELVGWTGEDGGAIQSGYTYTCPSGTSELYVYRVAIMTHGGIMIDLTWDQVKKFCADRGILYTPELFRMPKKQVIDTGLIQSLMDQRYFDKSFVSEGSFDFLETPVQLSNADTVDEGVCLRVDRDIPFIFKAKCPIFLGHETSMLDAEVVDLEAEQYEDIEYESTDA